MRAIPGSSVTAITGVRQGALVIKVTTAPEKGKANVTICEVLSGTLGVPKSSVRLIRGEHHRDKIFQVSGVSPEDVHKALIQV